MGVLRLRTPSLATSCATIARAHLALLILSLIIAAHRNHHVLASVKYAPPSPESAEQGIAYGGALMPNATQSLRWTAAAALGLGMFTSIGTGGAEGTPRINIATEILAQPASQAAVIIRLEPSEAVPRNSFVRLHGLPPSVSLTDGFAIGPGVWAVPLFALATLNVNVPVGGSGQSNLLVTLVDVEGTILAKATSALVVGPAVVLAPAEQAAAPSAENRSFSYRPASNSQPMAQLSGTLRGARRKAAGPRREPSGTRQYRRRSGILSARSRSRCGGRSNLACCNL